MPFAPSSPLLRSTLRGALRLCFKSMMGPPTSARVQRVWIEAVSKTGGVAASGMRRIKTQLDSVPCERIGIAGDAAAHEAILYLHGGAFCVGSPATHRALTTHLSRAAQRPVWVLDYRLAPEHPWPAQREDAMAAYRALLDQGIAADNIVIAGDSAGGALSVLTAVAIRDAGLPLPEALVLLSPMSDFEARGDSLHSHAERDPMLREDWLQQATAWLRGQGPPLPSPIDVPLHGLPRTLIHVGTEEILLSDAEGLAEKLQAAGVTMQIKRWTGLWHVFQVHAGLLAESTAAIAEIAAFITRTNGR